MYVILESHGTDGCGVVAEWRDDMPLRWVGQGIFSYSETRQDHEKALAEVVA